MKEQEIVKEYFDKQKTSKLKLCIYEEKPVNQNDIEWFYDEDNKDWCFFRTKKERYEGEIYENIFIEHKKIKTFGKKCHVTEMSFFNFMTIKTMEYFNSNEVTTNDVENYIKGYKELKKENPDISIEEYNTYKRQLLKDNEEKMKGCFMWGITIVLTFVCFPLAILTCPLTWKLIKKLKQKFQGKNDEQNTQQNL